MFFTTPFTIAPSFSVSRSCWRSTPAVSSMTARRETTTLLRLRSSLMTLNSSSLPSKCEVSFTGRRSTSEPGRKARMPFTMTVRPPFTLPRSVELDDLELELLAFEVRGVLHGTQVHERAGQEGADAVHHDGEAALHLAEIGRA